MSDNKTKHQIIAARIAEIANMHARILQSIDYDIPDDLETEIQRARNIAEAAGSGVYTAENEARNAFAAQYLERELLKLKDEANDLDIFLDPKLVEALIPSIEDTTRWNSSSYGC